MLLSNRTYCISCIGNLYGMIQLALPFLGGLSQSEGLSLWKAETHSQHLHILGHQAKSQQRYESKHCSKPCYCERSFVKTVTTIYTVCEYDERLIVPKTLPLLLLLSSVALPPSKNSNKAPLGVLVAIFHTFNSHAQSLYCWARTQRILQESSLQPQRHPVCSTRFVASEVLDLHLRRNHFLAMSMGGISSFLSAAQISRDRIHQALEYQKHKFLFVPSFARMLFFPFRCIMT